MSELVNGLKKKRTIILGVILIIATVFRVLLMTRIPSFIDGNAGYDDRLFIDYTDALVNGNWLGEYSFVTLVKGVSYPFFLAVVNFFNISYPKALIGIYILSIVLFVLAIRKLVKNGIVLSLFYLFLLYSPVMLYFEYVTRIYRNAIWVPSVLLAIACILGLFFSRKNKTIIEPLFWSLASGLSFLFFWYNREDSIWLLPLFIGAAIVTIITILLDKELGRRKIKRIVICVLPMLIFVGGTKLLSYVNLKEYGVYEVNDRTEGPFAEAMSLLTKIETDEEKIDPIWVSREAFTKGMEVSPTLKSVEESINWIFDLSGWAGEDGEVHGDIIFWAFRQGLAEHGDYYDSAVKSNDFFTKLTEELEDGFKSGKLKKKEGLFISKSGDGKTLEDAPVILSYLKYGLYATSTYANYDARLGKTPASDEDLALFSKLVKTRFIYPNTPDDAEIIQSAQPAIKAANHIIKIYNVLSLPILLLSLLGYGIIVINMFKNKFVEEDTTLFLIVTGLFLSYVILIFGVAWFSTWALDRRELFMTLYTGGGVPVLQVFELLCLFALGKATVSNFKSRGKHTA